MPEKKKIYILDTNVLIHDPLSIFTFEDAWVGIPAIVLEELDKFKSESGERGRNAREVIRHIDALRGQGSLKEGVSLANGSKLQIVFLTDIAADKRPELLSRPTEDNAIIYTALRLKEQGNQVVFITKDINARLKADILGVEAQDYLKGRVAEYEMYKGWRIIQVSSSQLLKGVPEELQELVAADEIEVNEFIWVQSKGNPYNYKVFRYLGEGYYKEVEEQHLKWPISPRNAQQLMTLDLLLDPSIDLVCLVGPAGTGKTFLALLAGLHQVLVEDLYQKMLISRPVIPLGPDIGYLPGDIQEKLHSWMQPMYDNMGIIVHSAANRQHLENIREENGRPNKYDKYEKKGRKKEPEKVGLRSLDDMIYSGKISLEAITYMRGRSIPYQYILIDEVQNLTPHEVKTLITRVGEGSKIILAGDPYQIDSPYLDFSSNGLIVASSAFKGQKIFGTVFLETSERSELSRLATELL